MKIFELIFGKEENDYHVNWDTLEIKRNINYKKVREAR